MLQKNAILLYDIFSQKYTKLELLSLGRKLLLV